MNLQDDVHIQAADTLGQGARNCTGGGSNWQQGITAGLVRKQFDHPAAGRLPDMLRTLNIEEKL